MPNTTSNHAVSYTEETHNKSTKPCCRNRNGLLYSAAMMQQSQKNKLSKIYIHRMP